MQIAPAVRAPSAPRRARLSPAELTSVKDAISGDFANVFSSRMSVDRSELRGAALRSFDRYGRSTVRPQAFSTDLQGHRLVVVYWSSTGTAGRLGLFSRDGTALAAGRWNQNGFDWAR